MPRRPPPEVLVALASALVRWVVAATRGRMGIDEAQFSSVAAYAWSHGESLYATPYSQWRPCVTGAYRLAVAIAGGPFALRLAEVFASLAVFATALLLARCLARTSRAASLAAAGLYPIAILAFEGAATRTEVFANLFVAGALAVRLEGAATPARRFLFGLLLGASGAEKPQYLALALLAPILELADGPTVAAFARTQVAAALGFLVPVALHWSLVAASAGTGPALSPFASYAASYSTSSAQHGVVGNLAFRLAPTLWDPVWLFALARALTVRGDDLGTPVERRLALGLGAAIVPLFLGLRLARHYFLIAAPFTVALAAPGLVRLVAAARARDAGARGVLAALALLALSEGLYLGASGSYAAPSDDRLLRPAGLSIAARTRPGDRILAWGWRPELYVHSDRAPASHWIDGLYLARDYGPPDPGAIPPPVDDALVARVVAELERDPPALIVDASAVSNNNPHFYALARYPRLVKFLAERYAPAAPLDGPIPLPAYERKR